MTYRGTLNDASGTVASGTVSQEALAAGSGRKYLLIQNPSTATEALWVNFTSAAAVDGASSISLAAGGSLVFEDEFCPGNAVNVTATTGGHKFCIKWG